jgi:hypothetical protein
MAILLSAANLEGQQIGNPVDHVAQLGALHAKVIKNVERLFTESDDRSESRT